MMNCQWWFVVAIELVFCTSAIEFETLSHIKSRTPGNEQTESVKELISRVIGGRSQEFQVLVDPSFSQNGKDTYQIVTENGVQKITGSSGVAVAMGFYYYIKYYCNGQFTWAGKQVSLPQKLPSIPSPGIKRSATDRFRYYQNVCTVSYSLAWLNWTRWERHIDWMALNGINLPLAFTGQEAIFQRVFMNMGFTFQDLEEHFGGPAFLAWARMGNIRGWGGPLPSTWITKRLVLQHKILKRMRSLGMIPVLPGFAGHVPAAITRLYPNAKVWKLGRWNAFNLTYSATTILEFEDPLFIKIGANFIKEMKNEFGVDHIYNADSFNEMVPKSRAPSYLMSSSRVVYEAMVEGDPQAIWLMQGWIFQSGWWGEAQTKALLTAVPRGKMIVLDLFAEFNPVYNRTKSFYGQPYIWCMLHNFGGESEFFGNMIAVNEGPFAARNVKNTTMIGTGITAEGIFQNEIIYELMNENSWRTEPRNLSLWVSQYIHQRYGQMNKDAVSAWHLLQRSVYHAVNKTQFNGKDWFIKRPGINNQFYIWYHPADVYESWKLMVKASESLTEGSLFRYDLVDVTRNSLQCLAIPMFTDIIQGYRDQNATVIKSAGKKLMKLFEDMEKVLASDTNFLLGNWIGDAKAWATDEQESALYEYNARNQLTLWGPNGEIVDYASKQWSGLVIDYYLPRWNLFIESLLTSVRTKKSFNTSEYNKMVLDTVEKPFTFSRKVYPRTATGDSVAISKQLLAYYMNMTEEHKQSHARLSKLYQYKHVHKPHQYSFMNKYVFEMEIDI